MMIKLVNDFMDVLLEAPDGADVQQDLYDAHNHVYFSNSLADVFFDLIDRGYVLVDHTDVNGTVDIVVTASYDDDGEVEELSYLVHPDSNTFHSLNETKDFKPAGADSCKANPIAHFKNAILKFTDYNGDIRLVKCTEVGQCGTYFDGTDLETGEAGMRFCVDEDIQGLVEIVK